MNTDQTNTQKGAQPEEQQNPDDVRIPTVTPDNDSGDPGAPDEKENSAEDEESSNKDAGPKGENL